MKFLKRLFKKEKIADPGSILSRQVVNQQYSPLNKQQKKEITITEKPQEDIEVDFKENVYAELFVIYGKNETTPRRYRFPIVEWKGKDYIIMSREMMEDLRKGKIDWDLYVEGRDYLALPATRHVSIEYDPIDNVYMRYYTYVLYVPKKLLIPVESFKLSDTVEFEKEGKVKKVDPLEIVPSLQDLFKYFDELVGVYIKKYEKIAAERESWKVYATMIAIVIILCVAFYFIHMGAMDKVVEFGKKFLEGAKLIQQAVAEAAKQTGQSVVTPKVPG